jgi:hypothetical protein
MKTELEKKLNKLPAYITVGCADFFLRILKTDDYPDRKTIYWIIEYKDSCENTLFNVWHSSLQAAVDTTLKEIKNL